LRQPERDEGQKRQKNAGNDENDHVEDGNALHDDGECEVRERLLAARVSLDVLHRRTAQQLPFVTLHVTRRVDLKIKISVDVYKYFKGLNVSILLMFILFQI